nr:hypothetical protein [uncultured Holophaga sp.]
MAHTIGTASNPNDLLDQLRVWLVTRGWTQDYYAAVSSGSAYGYRLHMHNESGTYLNARSYIGEQPTWYAAASGTGLYGIAFNLGTGYDSGSSWDYQPGAPLNYATTPQSLGSGMILGAGPYPSYQFFDDEAGNYLIAVERGSGIWRHICWGDSLDKTGAGEWEGGAYFGGTAGFGYWNYGSDAGSATPDYPPMPAAGLNGVYSYVNATVDGVTDWVSLKNYNLTVSSSATHIVGTSAVWAINHPVDSYLLSSWPGIPILSQALRNRLYQPANTRAILMPIPIWVLRSDGGSSFLGTVPSLAVSAHATLVTTMGIGDDMAIGAETWRLFNGFLVKVVG